jgi:hypothetical protein
MKEFNGLKRYVVAAGLSAALLGALSASALAQSASPACNSAKSETANVERHHWRAIREKFLAQAKVENAQLENMISELNRAPEANKPDLEAAILTKLVAQRQEMLADLEFAHARYGITHQNAPATVAPQLPKSQG